MPGTNPLQAPFTGIDGQVKNRHEAAGFKNIAGEMTVHGRHNFGNGAGLGSAHTQKGPGGGHQQGGIHPVAGDVAHHDAEGTFAGVPPPKKVELGGVGGQTAGDSGASNLAQSLYHRVIVHLRIDAELEGKLPFGSIIAQHGFNHIVLVRITAENGIPQIA